MTNITNITEEEWDTTPVDHVEQCPLCGSITDLNNACNGISCPVCDYWFCY